MEGQAVEAEDSGRLEVAVEVSSRSIHADCQDPASRRVEHLAASTALKARKRLHREELGLPGTHHVRDLNVTDSGKGNEGQARTAGTVANFSGCDAALAAAHAEAWLDGPRGPTTLLTAVCRHSADAV